MCLTCLPHAKLDIFHLNRSVQLLSDLHLLSSLKHHYLQTCTHPFSSQYYSSIEISQGLMSSPILPAFTLLHARFSQVNSCFTKVDISGEHLVSSGYIRIGNLILCQSFLSSPHRQTFHVCIQTEEGWLHLSRGAWTCTGEHAVAHPCSFLQPLTRDLVY